MWVDVPYIEVQFLIRWCHHPQPSSPIGFKAHERVQSVLLWIFVAQLGMLVGIEAVWLAVFGSDPSFNEAYHYPSLQITGVATSLYPVFAAIGAFSTLGLIHVAKSVHIMGVCLLLWLAGYLFGSLITGSIPALMAARIIKGLAIGALTSILPIYIGKVACRRSARLLTLFQATVPCGILLMALVGKLASSHVYRLRWIFAATPAFPIVLVMFNIPHVPDIINQKLQSETQMSACQKIKHDFSSINKVSGDDSWLRCIAACLAQIAGPTTAINVIFYYSSTMCQMLGFDARESDFMSIGLYSCNALGTLLSLLFINKLPRLATLQYSILAMGIIHAALFIVRLTHGFHPNTEVFGMVAVALFFGFVFIFSLLFAGISLVYTCEVVAPKARGISIGISTAVGWFVNFIIALCSPYLLPVMESYIFLLFTYLCCIVYFLFSLMPQPIRYK